MAKTKYNFFEDSYFTEYENVPEVTKNSILNTPLGDVDVSDWGYINPNGAIVANNNIETVKEESPRFIVNNNDEVEINPQNNEYQSSTINTSNKNSSNKTQKYLKGSETLSKIIDEVSNEPEYKKLKDPYIKYLLMLQAKRESSFNPSAKSSSSSASGYFQFIDGTRKKYSNVSKDEFLKNPKEQVRTAYKYLIDIHNSSSAIKLKEKGYNDSLITALGWWYPKSMDMVLNGKRNFSLGGYSIKKAFEDYG